VSPKQPHPFEEEAWLYALGVLDDENLAFFREHLASGCDACTRTIAEAEAAVAKIPLANEPRPLPSSARARIQERVLANSPVARAGPPPIRRRQPPRPRKRRAWTFIAAAVLLIGVLIIWLNKVRSERDAAMGQAADLKSRVAALQGTIARQVTEMSGFRRKLTEQTRLSELLGDPSLRIVELRARVGAEGARTRVFWSEAKRTGRFFAQGLPRLGPGKSYALWVMGEAGLSSAEPAGSFQTDEAGRASLSVVPPRHIAQVKAFAVTVEPEAGAPKEPTGPIVLIGWVGE
jgi:anti-sigma-K factor RskA